MSRVHLPRVADSLAREHHAFELFGREERDAERILDAVLDAHVGPALLLDAKGRVARLNGDAGRLGLRVGDDVVAREAGTPGVVEAVADELRRGEPVCFPGRGREWRTVPMRMSDESVRTLCLSDDA